MRTEALTVYFARREVGAVSKALHLCWAQRIPILELDLDIAAGHCLAKRVFGRVVETVGSDAGVRGLGGWEEEPRWGEVSPNPCGASVCASMQLTAGRHMCLWEGKGLGAKIGFGDFGTFWQSFDREGAEGGAGSA